MSSKVRTDVLVWQATERRLGQQKLWWLHSRCAEARGCIGRTFAYIDTQIPLAYIHLLALLVKLTLLVMAIEAGVALGLWLEQQQPVTHAKHESWHSMEADVLEQQVSFSVSSIAWLFLRSGKPRQFTYCVMDAASRPCFYAAIQAVFSAFFQLTIWALFLQGMLQVQAVLANPFGRDRLDFPAKSFHRYIRNEALSFLVAAQEFETVHLSSSARRPCSTNVSTRAHDRGPMSVQQEAHDKGREA